MKINRSYSLIIPSMCAIYNCTPPSQKVGRDPDYDSIVDSTQNATDLEQRIRNDAATRDFNPATTLVDSRNIAPMDITIPSFDASVAPDYQLRFNQDLNKFPTPILDANIMTRDAIPDSCYDSIKTCKENTIIQYDSCGGQRELERCDPNRGFICDKGSCVVQPGEVLNGRDDNNNGRIDEGYIGQAPLQFVLYWENQADLDLRVQSPDECSVYYDNPSCYQGALDRDANPSCRMGSLPPPENIMYEIPQSGRYNVFVNLNTSCDTPFPIPFFVAIDYNGQITEYPGQIENSTSTLLITQFDLN